jgi:hypothetical protein
VRAADSRKSPLPLTPTVEPVEKVLKEIFGRDAGKNDLSECVTINDLHVGKGKLTPENCL